MPAPTPARVPPPVPAPPPVPVLAPGLNPIATAVPVPTRGHRARAAFPPRPRTLVAPPHHLRIRHPQPVTVRSRPHLRVTSGTPLDPPGFPFRTDRIHHPGREPGADIREPTSEG
ncbi:hypothetical protein GCM10010515_01290 [Streptomyces fructofermentans]|uniref:Uncharacterized protein n=1 Tax=Streptomyces fructofermentans TaxID=152141 RepID=A0A918N4M8_9ACTN|nr:hypothetical protein GCM10010515_01290 [Streptomyces fructofermentans]